ncbi:MAG: DUF1015 domain-containing protein [Candidatus Omnitrophica bacterium]|jgi:uncharacterized protein (DUF1015 family)|nr:DUF1015 domain-containing protein [Candidatus Omnitrophota bacterium]
MAKIKPFQAFAYNQDKISDISKVVCPPYDVISLSQQQAYTSSHKNNFVHIILPEDLPAQDRYQHAAFDFKSWIEEGILAQDKLPAVYFYSQTYNLKGEKKTRLGFIALLGLEDKGSGVFKHEFTRSEPKEDRLKLIRQVKANLSPIFAVFSDRKRVVQQVFQRYVQDKVPFIDIIDRDNVSHKLWRVDSEAVLADIQKKMQDEDIFIADGHHRYEVACIYREEMRKKLGNLTGEEGCNYIMAYFTNADNRGLTIMPINRLLQEEPGFDFGNFCLSLKEYFDVEEVKDKEKFSFLMQKAGSAEHIIGMYKEKKFWLLRLKNVKILDKMINDKPKDYRSLDVSVLNYIVFKKILKLDIENKEKLYFYHDEAELIRQADKNKGSIAFFLNPVRMKQIIAVALSGERMPSKSTYFYPKVLSGLVINKF